MVNYITPDRRPWWQKALEALPYYLLLLFMASPVIILLFALFNIKLPGR